MEGYCLEKLIENLRQRNIEAFYFENWMKAKEKILEMIPVDETVGIGNSQTLKKMGLSHALIERGKAGRFLSPLRGTQSVCRL